MRASVFKMNKQTNKPTYEKLHKPNEPTKCTNISLLISKGNFT